MFELLERKFPHHELSTIAIGWFPDGVKRNMDLEEIESHLRKEKRPWVKEKLQALAWLAKGMKVKEVGKRLGRNQGLIRHWLWQYYKTGIGWFLQARKWTLRVAPSEVWKK